MTTPHRRYPGRHWLLLAASLLLIVVATPPLTSEEEEEAEEPKVTITEVEPNRAAERREAPARHDGGSSHAMMLRGGTSSGEVYEGNQISFMLLAATRLQPRKLPGYPAPLEELNGQIVRIPGYMQAFDDLVSMRNFMLMPTPGSCNFCAPPAPTMVVLVRQDIPEGGNAPFVSHPVMVEGRLKLWHRESKDPAHRMFLYVIEDARVSKYVPPDPPAMGQKGVIPGGHDERAGG